MGVATPAPNEDEPCAFVRQDGCGPATNRQASFGTLSKKATKGRRRRRLSFSFRIVNLMRAPPTRFGDITG